MKKIILIGLLLLLPLQAFAKTEAPVLQYTNVESPEYGSLSGCLDVLIYTPLAIWGFKQNSSYGTFTGVIFSLSASWGVVKILLGR